MSIDPRYAAVILAILLSANQTRADSLSARRAAKEKVETIEGEIACGKLDKENCAVVVPEINSKTVSQGVRLKPLESKGSVESINGLCDGDIEVAVMQADVLAARVGKPDCTGKVFVLGAPLYPYEGFMVVRGDTREDKFGDLVNNLKPGTVLRVAAAFFVMDGPQSPLLQEARETVDPQRRHPQKKLQHLPQAFAALHFWPRGQGK